jgi:hypothetical protein
MPDPPCADGAPREPDASGKVARNGAADSQAMMPPMIAGPRDRRGDRKAFASSRAKDARDRASGAACAFWAATFAARSGFRFKVALAIGAGGNFGRPLITVDRRDTSEVSGGGVLGDSKDLGGVRWGVLEVSGVGSFWRRGHLLRASPRRLSYRRAGPLVPQSSPASWLANRPCHPCHSCHLCD